MSAEYPTPLYAHAARGHFRDVYEPSEDSFLLMDALEKDVDELRQMRPRVCVEVGSGSGAVSAFLASMLGPSAIYFCTDVNRAAALCTAKTASRNGVSLEPVVTDLVECLLPRLSGQVDVLLFNPPYVVTPSSGKHGHGSRLGRRQAGPGGHRQIFTGRIRVAVQSRAVLLGRDSRERSGGDDPVTEWIRAGGKATLADQSRKREAERPALPLAPTSLSCFNTNPLFSFNCRTNGLRFFCKIHDIAKSICSPALTPLQYEFKCHPIPNPECSR
ncbi:methyltransferase N6AMT1 isoform X2 [Phyllopteryx taeniolatus]|uniref:methyltransferase N6AMT1 isoform X2 n=1 Tax=Phyllopteryx taeniolatus TaxID=161469 RepID=UPI002AD2E4E6|nr:methyltransferase N6AMT1 isoform X2 [Phyllopteryx taeniolatus]